jgi:hypothetical protein
MNDRLAALVERGRAPDVLDGVGRDRAVDGLAAVDALIGWCEAQRARWATVLAAECEAPEVVVAEASRCSTREADRLTKRATTLDAMPSFADALAGGRVAAGHVDALTRGLTSLDTDDQRARLAAEASRLEHAATVMTPDEFAKRVRREVQRIQAADGGDDADARLARQRRAARLRTWVDRDSGMWCLTGRFDPLTGLAIHNQLQQAVETMFREQQPAHAPSDPGERQDFLRAQAFVKLLSPPPVDTCGRPVDGGAVPAPVERPRSLAGVVVIDTAQLQPDGTPAVDWGIPIEVPLSVLAELSGQRHVDCKVVLVCNGVVLHVPGALNLGRSTRMANRAQRRALHALYRTCALPGCTVDYRLCKLHHIIWWRNGGHTDLDNLLPLCERHHHAVHDRGWRITLGRRRELTIHLPDGTTLATGPPSRSGP